MQIASSVPLEQTEGMPVHIGKVSLNPPLDNDTFFIIESEQF